MKELRLTEIKKEQDALIIEIDRVVQKRDIIQVKYNQKESQQYYEETDLVKIKTLKNNNKTQVSKNIELLKGSIQQSQKNIAGFEKQCDKLEKENGNAQNVAESSQQQIEAVETELRTFNSYIQGYKLRKLVNVLRIHQAQQKALFFEKVLKSGKVIKAGQSMVDALAAQSEKGRRMVEAMRNLVSEQSELKYVEPIINDLELAVRKDVDL